MLVNVSLRQLLLYQMGYLLFNELKQNNNDNGNKANYNENVMERLQTLQTAFEQLKSYQHNIYFQEMIENFDFDLDEEELKELDEIDNDHDNDLNTNNKIPTYYLHPFGFGMWLQEQSFIDLNWTGTMDDSETTKQFWRQLTGNTFIKNWKKQKITKENIIEHYSNAGNNDNNSPFIDISIHNSSVVKASQFRLSLCRNRIFEILIPSKDHGDEPQLKSRPSNDRNTDKEALHIKHPSYFANVDGQNGQIMNTSSTTSRKSRHSVDHGTDGKYDISNAHSMEYKSRKNNRNISDEISGINLFNTVVNQNILRIACCILWQPKLANAVLKEFIINPAFDINGKHKTEFIIKEDSFPPIPTDQPTPTSTTPYGSSFDDAVYRLELPMVGQQLNATQSTLSVPSIASSPAPPSICSQGRFSNISTATSYTGNGNLQCDMEEDEIYKYLLEMDYSDKKNPVKYEWKLMVDALNAFQFKVISIDDYTDNDILKMVNRLQEGLVNSIHDQRSGLIKVACHLFVLIAQYRTPLFFDEELFKFWMVCLLRKCANRDKIRTLPAHNACRDIVACILSYYVNNKDNSKEFLLHKLSEMFIIFSSLWTPNNIDPLWMKQVKSVTQFIKNISLMIQHTAILHKAPSNIVDKSIKFKNIDNEEVQHQKEQKEEEKEKEKNDTKPIENQDIKQMQDIAFDLFKKFTKQSHKEARECGVQLLINLYKLEKEKTFEFAKQHFVKRELMDYLKKVQKLEILSEEHKSYLDSLSNRGGRSRIRKGIKKKKKKDGSSSSSGIKSQIKKLKKQKKKPPKSPTVTIPEETILSEQNKVNNEIKT